MAIPSIVNWLNDDIDFGNASSALYVAEVSDYPGLITIGYCTLDLVDQLQSLPHLGRIRYVTCVDPVICDSRSSLSLKDCWLGEQFLLFQLSDYREIQALDFDGVCIIMGSEDVGISRSLKTSCDDLFSIPILGTVDCLNISVACGIILYEVVKNR